MGGLRSSVLDVNKFQLGSVAPCRRLAKLVRKAKHHRLAKRNSVKGEATISTPRAADQKWFISANVGEEDWQLNTHLDKKPLLGSNTFGKRVNQTNRIFPHRQITVQR